MTTGGISGPVPHAVLSKAVQPTTAQHLSPAPCPQPGTVPSALALVQRQIIPMLSIQSPPTKSSAPVRGPGMRPAVP